MHLHISGRYLLTARPDPGGPLDQLHGVTDFGPHGEEDVVYRVLDTLTDAIFPVIDLYEERIDALEEAVLAAPDEQQLAAIYRLKQEVQGCCAGSCPSATSSGRRARRSSRCRA